MRDRYADLRQRLARSSYAALGGYIDWDVAPRRSLLTVFTTVLLGVLAIVAFFAVGVAGAAAVWAVIVVRGEAREEVPSASTPVWDILASVWAPAFAFFAFIFAARLITSAVVRPSRQEISKFPELSLFARRKPTVYLRRFVNENPSLVSEYSTSADFRERVAQHVTDRFNIADRSFENLLAKSVDHVGPLICLSDPQRRRKTGEARRVAIRSEVWQPAVNVLLDHANLVVMEFTGGASLDWEANRVLNETRLPLLIWLPVPADKPKWLDGIMSASAIESGCGQLVLASADRSRVSIRNVKPTFEGLRRAILDLLNEQDIRPVSQSSGRGVPIGQRVAAVAVWLAPWMAIAAVLALIVFWAQPSRTFLDEAVDQTVAAFRFVAAQLFIPR